MGWGSSQDPMMHPISPCYSTLAKDLQKALRMLPHEKGLLPHLPCRSAGQLPGLLETMSQPPWAEQFLLQKRTALHTCACLRTHQHECLSCVSAQPLSGCTRCNAWLSGLLSEG